MYWGGRRESSTVDMTAAEKKVVGRFQGSRKTHAAAAAAAAEVEEGERATLCMLHHERILQ